MSLAGPGSAPRPPAGRGSHRRTGRWSLPGGAAVRQGCSLPLWVLAPTFQGTAVSAARVEGDFGGFPSLLWRKPFQPPNAGGGRGPAVPAGVPGSRGRLLTSRGIFSSGLTGPPYVCVLLFPFAFYVLSRCREEWRSLPVTATVRFCCLVFCSPLLGGFPELCL